MWGIRFFVKKIQGGSCLKFRERCSLVGDFNPFEKYYSSQNGNLPQVGMKIKKYLKPPPRNVPHRRHLATISRSPNSAEPLAMVLLGEISRPEQRYMSEKSPRISGT